MEAVDIDIALNLLSRNLQKKLIDYLLEQDDLLTRIAKEDDKAIHFFHNKNLFEIVKKEYPHKLEAYTSLPLKILIKIVPHLDLATLPPEMVSHISDRALFIARQKFSAFLVKYNLRLMSHKVIINPNEIPENTIVLKRENAQVIAYIFKAAKVAKIQLKLTAKELAKLKFPTPEQPFVTVTRSEEPELVNKILSLCGYPAKLSYADYEQLINVTGFYTELMLIYAEPAVLFDLFSRMLDSEEALKHYSLNFLPYSNGNQIRSLLDNEIDSNTKIGTALLKKIIDKINVIHFQGIFFIKNAGEIRHVSWKNLKFSITYNPKKNAYFTLI